MVAVNKYGVTRRVDKQTTHITPLQVNELTVNEVKSSQDTSCQDLVVHEGVHGIFGTTVKDLEGEGQGIGEDVGLQSVKTDVLCVSKIDERNALAYKCQ